MTTAVLCNRSTDQHLCRRQVLSCTSHLLSVSGWVTDKRCRESFSGVLEGITHTFGEERTPVHGETACALATRICLKQSSNENMLVQLATSLRLDTLPDKDVLMHSSQAHV